MGRVYTTTGIALTDSAGGTTVDPVGIVGTTSFTLTTDEDGANPISGTAYTLIGGCDRAIVLERAAPVLVCYGGGGTVPGGTMTVRLYISDSAGTNFFGRSLLYNSGSAQNAFFVFPRTALTGTTTYQLHASLSGAGTADFGVGGMIMSIIAFGK